MSTAILSRNNFETGTHLESKFGHMVAGVGIRKKAYLISTLSLMFWAVIGWGGVMLGIFPADPTDDYAGATTFFAMWMALFAFLDNPGENRTLIQKLEEFIFVWLISSGLAQIFWELPFVLIKTTYLYPLGQVLSHEDSWLWPFWLYASGDTRYMSPHEASHATETLLAISGFFEILAAYYIKTGKKYKTGLIMAALLHWGFMWANNSVIYLGEIYAGFKNIEDGMAGFWIKWLGMNMQWSVLSPLCTFSALYLLMKKSEEEGVSKYLNQNQKPL